MGQNASKAKRGDGSQQREHQMGKVISFHDNPVVELRKELQEKEKQLIQARHEAAFFKSIYSSTSSIGDLLKLQLADLNSNVMILQGHLKLVQDNLDSVRTKMENLDQMKNKVRITDQ